MRPPFPGMDPYLEHPDLWPDVHNSLITALRDDLAGELAPRYFVGVEERIYAVEFDEPHRIGSSDVSVSTPPRRYGTAAARIATGAGLLEVELPADIDEFRETHLEIRKVDTRAVVAVVEILSPTNKSDARGRALFELKRRRVLESDAHYVEIDLLRSGDPMPLLGDVPPAPYRVFVSRAEIRPKAHLLVFGLRGPIPTFKLPLLPGDDEPTVDLGAVLHALYGRARYDLLLDRTKPPVPPLDPEDRAWAEELTRSAG